MRRVSHRAVLVCAARAQWKTDGKDDEAGSKSTGKPTSEDWYKHASLQAPIFPGQGPTLRGKNIDAQPIPLQNLSQPTDPRVETAFNVMSDGGSGESFAFRKPSAKKAGGAKQETPAASGATKRRAGGDAPPKSVDDVENTPEGAAKAPYKKSVEAFKSERVILEDSFAGEAAAQKIVWWENIWWNYIKYLWTRDILVGKDRWGNRFTASWYFIRSRHEVRKCKRKDKRKAFQPYGALPTDDKLWEAWLRGWRNDPPTLEECEALRAKRARHMGVHKLDTEEVEDSLVRLLATTRPGSAFMNELDPDQKYANSVLLNTDQRANDKDVASEWEGTWTAGFIRGDQFYNEEETETMRTTMSHVYRDREWQTLEMKRQTRLRKAPHPIGKPDEDTEDLTSPFAEGRPVGQDFARTDSHVPMHQGIADLTTPELEKLRMECDALEDERVALRKELGLMDLTDFREGRESIDQGFDPFQPPPTSGRWKPKCWQESWGVGGANPY
jgi:hypothetical protein